MSASAIRAAVTVAWSEAAKLGVRKSLKYLSFVDDAYSTTTGTATPTFNETAATGLLLLVSEAKARMAEGRKANRRVLIKTEELTDVLPTKRDLILVPRATVTEIHAGTAAIVLTEAAREFNGEYDQLEIIAIDREPTGNFITFHCVNQTV